MTSNHFFWQSDSHPETSIWSTNFNFPLLTGSQRLYGFTVNYGKLAELHGIVVRIFLRSFPAKKRRRPHRNEWYGQQWISQTYHDVVRTALWFQWQSCPHCGISVAVPHGTSERTNTFITISREREGGFKSTGWVVEFDKSCSNLRNNDVCCFRQRVKFDRDVRERFETSKTLTMKIYSVFLQHDRTGLGSCHETLTISELNFALMDPKVTVSSDSRTPFNRRCPTGGFSFLPSSRWHLSCLSPPPQGARRCNFHITKLQPMCLLELISSHDSLSEVSRMQA